MPVNTCGPYHSNGLLLIAERTCPGDNPTRAVELRSNHFGIHSHDTISMAVIDKVSR